jgi:hypothetical protein
MSGAQAVDLVLRHAANVVLLNVRRSQIYWGYVIALNGEN